jgi:LPS-assembly lipoprotein
MLKRLHLVTVLIPLILSACGWQLRDSGLLSADIGAVHLASNSSVQSHLLKDLKRALNRADIPVVALQTEANYSIVILDIRHSRRSSTLNAGGRVAEYQLNHEVDYIILGATGNQLSPLSTASVERVFEFEEQDVLASANGEQAILEQMRREAVRQILTQLSQLAPTDTAAQ